MCMKEVFRPHPKHRPMIWGPLTSHKKFRGMTKTQYTQSIVELINISNRMDREEISKPIILLVYRFVKPREFVEFLSLLEKIIFRNFCVDKTRIDKGSIDFGKFCKTFFDSVKGKEPSNPADAKQITKAFNKLKRELCDWSLDTKKYGFSNRQLYQKIVQEKDAFSKNWTRYFLYHWEMYGPGSYQPLIRMAKECSNWGDPDKNFEFFQREHVMPQTGWSTYPTKKIPGMVERYYWQDQYQDRADYGDDINWLGNLVLSKSKPNSEYKNYPYVRHSGDPDGPLKEKRSMYLTEPGVHDWKKVKQIAIEYKVWNVNAIKHRQKRMAQWACAHWRLPCEPKPVFDPIDVIDELSDEFFLIYDESYSAADAEKIKHDLVMTKFVEVEQKKDRSHPETDYSGCEDEHAVVELTDDFDLHYERDANDLEYEEVHKAKSGKTLTVKKKH